jgi:hypothetical protein
MIISAYLVSWILLGLLSVYEMGMCRYLTRSDNEQSTQMVEPLMVEPLMVEPLVVLTLLGPISAALMLLVILYLLLCTLPIKSFLISIYKLGERR